jgi:periplasmic copper chaperone A
MEIKQMRSLLVLMVLGVVGAAGAGHAQLINSENPNKPSSGQVAAALPPLVSPNSTAMPDALVERQLKDARRVNTVKAWAKVAAERGNTAVYLTLRGGPEDDRLLSVNTPWSSKAELHDTVIDEEGVVRMRPIKSLLVSAQSEILFAPGGRHIMLTGIKRDLRRGAMFPVNLIFEKAGTVRAMVEVRGPLPGQVSATQPADGTPVVAGNKPAPTPMPPEHQH